MVVSICTKPHVGFCRTALLVDRPGVMKILCCLMIGLGLTALTSGAGAETLPSLYTNAQAQSGAGLYAQTCAMCHHDAVAGRTFVRPGAPISIGGIFDAMVTDMPLTQPGGLTQQQYTDIMAYALQKNGYPAGDHALTYQQALNSTQPFVNKPQ